MLSILYGLGAALGWGAGDFTGGLAARKAGAYRAVFYGEIVGIVVLVAALFISGDAFPDSRSVIFSMLAGAFGTIGLMLLYHSMTLGLMSVAAPVSALLAAAFPVLVSSLTEGLPKWVTLIGFGFALFAVWMVSQSEGGVTDVLSHLADLKLPLLAGIGFGSYFVFMHQATQNAAIWPMVISRSTGTALITVVMLARRDSWTVPRDSWTAISLNGVLDICGNIFFILASQTGRLDVAAVLSSLFPGATVLLASIFLKERLTRNQWIGILSALTAIVLITI